MLENLQVTEYGGGHWKVSFPEISTNHILVDRETAFYLTCIKAVSLDRNLEPYKDEWWISHADTSSLLCNEPFIPARKVESLLKDFRERIKEKVSEQEYKTIPMDSKDFAHGELEGYRWVIDLLETGDEF